MIGSAIPAPVLGPIAGFTAGVLGSMAFDWCYDNADMLIVGAQNVGNAIVDKVTDTGEKIGEAVSGFFGDLGSVFS
ncbi:hypothetical protein KM885_07780 [Oceanobacillus caeni]|nr:hypothetical protein [Oceanobacillus caeni]